MRFNFATNTMVFNPIKDCRKCEHLRAGLRDAKMCKFVDKKFKEKQRMLKNEIDDSSVKS
jgi:hypothetical protein